MADEDVNGWWSVPASDSWRCPECGEWSPCQEWTEHRVACDECGDHDGRECPRCGAAFDHVWGSEQIAQAMSQ